MTTYYYSLYYYSLDYYSLADESSPATPRECQSFLCADHAMSSGGAQELPQPEQCPAVRMTTQPTMRCWVIGLFLG
uniref:Uncharacterized protein n=1 Tax=Arundo donax TaxID=35708 RepID=A0A0A8ZYD6_ARUDO